MISIFNLWSFFAGSSGGWIGSWKSGSGGWMDSWKSSASEVTLEKGFHDKLVFSNSLSFCENMNVKSLKYRSSCV